MSKYIIGCSNIYRHYNLNSALHGEYTILKATNASTFENALQGFTDNGKPIIIAIIENLIEDAIRNTTSQSEARELGKKAIDKLIQLIKANERNYPDSVVAVVKPTRRPSLEWFECNIKGWTEDLENAVTGGKMKYLAIMETIEGKEQSFEEDGTHLTKKSGEFYITYLMELGRQMPIQEASKKEKEKDQRMEVDKPI